MKVIDRFDGEYAFLSNFFHQAGVPIIDDMRIAYSTVEHAFQAAKSMDSGVRAQIALAKTPGSAKRMGRAVRPLRPDWERVRNSVMKDCLRQKFSDPALRKLLLDTGDAKLIEGNTWGDTFWGVDVKKGGLNQLGKLLMELRTELRTEDEQRVGIVSDR